MKQEERKFTRTRKGTASMGGLMTIHFDAELRQIRTMADGSFNLIINIPEYNLKQAQELMGWLRDQIAVAIVRVSEAGNDNLS